MPLVILLSLSFFSVTYSALSSSKVLTLQGSIASGAASPVWTQNCEALENITSNWSTQMGMVTTFDMPSYFGYNPHGDPNCYADIVTDNVHSGTKCIKLTAGGSGGSNSRIELDLWPNGLRGYPPYGTMITTDFYFSWWMWLSADTLPRDNSGSTWLGIFQLEGITGSGAFPIAKLMVNPDGTTFLEWQDERGVQYKNVATAGTIPRDQWVHMEWYTKIATDGRFIWWVNGNKMWDKPYDTDAYLLESAKPLYFMPCIYGVSGIMYIDDIALYDVNMNGNAP